METMTNYISSDMQEYDSKLSYYIPSKVERINNVSSRASPTQVQLIFLFKKNDAHAKLLEIGAKDEYKMPKDMAYYDDLAKNNEAKWRIYSSKLRMEFYLDMLSTFANPGENVLGIYTGSKCMLAAKVRALLVLHILNLRKLSAYADNFSFPTCFSEITQVILESRMT